MDNDVINLAKAIRQHESGGKFDAKGASKEYGAYQFTKPTWQNYAKQVLGDQNAQPTPSNQNAVAYGMIKTWKDQGLNPAQIAAKWNSGSEKGWENKRGVNKYGVRYDVPAYVSKVTGLYQQYRGQQPQIQQQSQQQPQIDPTQEQRQQMVASGQPVSVNPERTTPTFGGQVVRGFLKPFARGLNTLSGIGEEIAGEGAKQRQSAYLGDVTGYGMREGDTPWERVKDVAGGALDIGSNFVGFGAAKSAVTPLAKAVVKGVAQEGAEQVGRSALRQGAQIAKEGALGGAMAGLGTSLQEGDTFGQSLGQTASGAALGGGLGFVLGATAAKLAQRGITPTPTQVFTESLVERPELADTLLDKATNDVFDKSIGKAHQVNKFVTNNFGGDREAYKDAVAQIMREGISVDNLVDGSWDLLTTRNSFLKGTDEIIPELGALYDEIVPPLTAQHLEKEILYRIKQNSTGTTQTAAFNYFKNRFKQSLKGIKNQRDLSPTSKIKGQDFWTLMKDLRLGAYDDMSPSDVSSAKRIIDKIMQDVLRKYAADPVGLEKLLKANREFTTRMDAINLLDVMKKNPFTFSQLSTHMAGLITGAAAANPLAYMGGRMASKVGLEKWSKYMLSKALNKEVFDSEPMRQALTKRIQRLQ